MIEIAKSWLRTPYHDGARIKGAGVDCATLIAEVFAEAGVIPHVEIEPYSAQWHMHRDEEKYLGYVTAYAREIEGPPNPADVVMFRFGRLFSHGAIVIAWPTIIHSRIGHGCEYADAEKNAWLARVGEGYEKPAPPRPRRFFSFWNNP